MVKRLLLLTVVIALLGVGIYLGPRQPDPPGSLPELGPGPYLVCPGGMAGGGFSGRLGLYAPTPGSALVSVVGAGRAPSAVPIAETGGAAVAIEELAELGAAPLLVELADAAAATQASAGSAVSLTGCGRASAGPLAVLGISTAANELASLTLVNPFTSDARAVLDITSELGRDTPASLEVVRVPANATIDLPLERILTGRDRVAVVIRTEAGLVAAAMRRGNDLDFASTEGVEGAGEWLFPLPALGIDPVLQLRPLSEVETAYRVDLFDPDGTVEGAAEGSAAPGEVVEIELADLPGNPGGLLVSATEPIAAVLVYREDSLRAVTAGATGASLRWVVPVTAVGTEGESVVWILNPGDIALSAVLTPLNGAAPIPVDLAPGQTTGMVVRSQNGAGLFIDASGPVVAMAGTLQQASLALTMASPVS
jgi:hypothetical protein